MLKIKVGDFIIGKNERKAIRQVLDKGQLSEGRMVYDFERRWANFIGTKYCIAVNSGTSALIAGLYAVKTLYKLKDKSKVITSPLTFIATVNAIVASGFEPVFVDVNPDTFVIKPEEIAKAVRRQKDMSVILPVHLMGYPANMLEINKIARKNNLIVIEDAAQAHGTRYIDKKLGAFSKLSCFSFYIAHNIQAGEMGAVATDDYDIFRLVKKLKAHGRMCDCSVCLRSDSLCPRMRAYKGEDDFDPRFYHDMFGLNFKTMEFQAALGISQLKRIKFILKKRSFNVRYLNMGLSPLKGVLKMPLYSKEVSYLAYPIIINNPKAISRKAIRNKLEEAGIETRPLFGCIPTQQPAYLHLKKKYDGMLPNAEYLGRNGFYIGCHQYLKRRDLDYIIKTFKRILKGV